MRIIIGTLATFFTFNMLAIDWPQWRGPNRDGVNPEKNLLEKWPEGGPKLLWRDGGVGGGFSSVATSDGVLYTLGDLRDACYLFALVKRAGLLVEHAYRVEPEVLAPRPVFLRNSRRLASSIIKVPRFGLLDYVSCPKNSTSHFTLPSLLPSAWECGTGRSRCLKSP